MVAVTDGIADFLPAVPTRDSGFKFNGHLSPARVLPALRAAAGPRWPTSLGETIVAGADCAGMVQALLVDKQPRHLLVADPDMDVLGACRTVIAQSGSDPDINTTFVRCAVTLNDVRDAVADTIICGGAASGILDTGAFFRAIHRVLKPGGRAAVVVPNRRYCQAISATIAETLIRQATLDQRWPACTGEALDVIARARRLILHASDTAFLETLDEKHLFDPEALEDLASQTGFAMAESLPLDPDPFGAATVQALLGAAPEADSFAPLVASTGAPWFALLAPRDSSLWTVLWLTKARGPEARIFSADRLPQAPAYAGANVAVGGVPPRWSIELTASDTPEGIAVSVGGWVVCNTDVRWVRLTLDGIAQDTPVWRPRADVQDVLNRDRRFHPVNALCSGLDGELHFPGVHDQGVGCRLRVEIVLTNGLVVTGPAPETLTMNETMVIAH